MTKGAAIKAVRVGGGGGWDGKSQNRAGRRLIDFVNTFRPARNLSFPFAALKKGRGPARSNDNANIWIGLSHAAAGIFQCLIKMETF